MSTLCGRCCPPVEAVQENAEGELELVVAPDPTTDASSWDSVIVDAIRHVETGDARGKVAVTL